MNWKIVLSVSLIGLVAFFVFDKCNDDDKKSYDKVQAEERAKRDNEYSNKQANEYHTKKQKAQEAARVARGDDRKEALFHVLETDEFKAEFTTKGGALVSMAMKDPQYMEAPRDWNTGLRDEDAEVVPVDMVTTNAAEYESFSPLRFNIYEGKGLEALLPDADYEISDKSKSHVTFRYAQPDVPVVIYKKFEIVEKSGPYQLWLTIRVANTGDEKLAFRSSVSQRGYQHETEAEGGMFTKQPNLLKGICRYQKDTESIPWNDDDLEKPFVGVGDVNFTGVHNNFFLSAMFPGDDTPSTCRISRTIDYHQAESYGVVTAELRFAETELKPGESKVFKVKNYLGPKRYQVLQRVGGGLEKSVDFGYLWFICQFLLMLLFFFQGYVVNWGVAIILLTVAVKMVLLPLTHKSYQSTNRMKALKPEIDKINEKFKDNPQEKQQATMALYKQHKINPLGGCLPMVLQMPIWFALYSTLRTTPELYRAPFFGWITDLSSSDPYFVTPILMGAAMFMQSWFQPPMGDPLQAKIMKYFMPLMMTGMMLFLPSGLTLYIFVNILLSILQQWFIQNRSKKKSGKTA